MGHSKNNENNENPNMQDLVYKKDLDALQEHFNFMVLCIANVQYSVKTLSSVFKH